MKTWTHSVAQAAGATLVMLGVVQAALMLALQGRSITGKVVD